MSDRVAKYTDVPILSIKHFGAVGDAITDDTAAIQAALAVGGLIFVPPTATGNYYKVSAPLLISKPTALFGAGSVSAIVATAFGATDDVIRIIPNIGGINTNFSIRDIVIGAVGSCRHGVHIDLTGAGVPGLGFFLMDRVFVNVNSAGTVGRSFKLTNPTNNDGFAISKISGCQLLGGIEMQRCGDSVYIVENQITLHNTGIDLSFTVGAAQVVIEKNNITSNGGGIILHNGIQTKIRNNQIEQLLAYTGSEVACVVVKGDTAQISACEIHGNNINTQSLITYAIDVQNAIETSIFDNDILAVAAHIRVGAAAVNTIISKTRNRWVDPTFAPVPMNITNAGTGTAGPYTAPTLQNGWTQFDSVNFPVRYAKDEAGMVTLEGTVAAGTIVLGTVIYTLPVGFRPSTNLKFSVLATDGMGVAGQAQLLINQSGEVQYWTGNSAAIHINLTFKVW